MSKVDHTPKGLPISQLHVWNQHARQTALTPYRFNLLRTVLEVVLLRQRSADGHQPRCLYGEGGRRMEHQHHSVLTLGATTRATVCATEHNVGRYRMNSPSGTLASLPCAPVDSVPSCWGGTSLLRAQSVYLVARRHPCRFEASSKPTRLRKPTAGPWCLFSPSGKQTVLHMQAYKATTETCLCEVHRLRLPMLEPENPLQWKAV